MVREILADTLTPIGLVSLLRRDRNRYFLLESLEKEDPSGRYSFIGCDPRLRLTAKAGKAQLEGENGQVETLAEDPLTALRRLLKEYAIPSLPDLPPFTGGLVGYFSYDFIQYCEPSLHFSIRKKGHTPSQILT